MFPVNIGVGFTLGFDLLKDLSLSILPATQSENVSIMTWKLKGGILN